jgi:hypothetical protein
MASRSHALLKTKETYESLQKARRAVRQARSAISPCEDAIRRQRQNLYYWNNIHRAAKASRKTNGSEENGRSRKITTATWSHHNVEDNTEYLDITGIMVNSRGKKRRIVFSGTDYGVSIMSETVAQTFEEIEDHINRYDVLGESM